MVINALICDDYNNKYTYRLSKYENELVWQHILFSPPNPPSLISFKVSIKLGVRGCWWVSYIPFESWHLNYENYCLN